MVTEVELTEKTFECLVILQHLRCGSFRQAYFLSRIPMRFTAPIAMRA